MFLIALCDDDPLHTQDILYGVDKILGSDRQNTRTFPSSQQLLDHIKQGYQPNIALLDICMPGINGIELGRQINQLLPDCQIIFITSFLSFAPEAYDAAHVYFVLKPQLRQRLPLALERAITALEAQHSELLLQKDGASFMVAIDDVCYIERVLRKTQVITAEGAFQSRHTPMELVEASPSFLRCHQSYWVNLSHVQCMENNRFLLDTGSRIPISRTYQHNARQQFFRSLVEEES